MSKKGKLPKLIIVTLITTLGTSCGVLNDMNDMKNTTTQMKNITEKMNQTTKELAEISKAMSKTTHRIGEYSAYTYRDMRLDTSISNGFKALTEMENAKSLEQKSVAAAYYLASFEFQLWKNRDLDTPDLRKKMYELSVKRFFADLKEYAGKASADELPPTNDDQSTDANNLKNLYALAAVLHEVNPNQAALAQINKIPVVSMLDLITEGLSAIKNQNLLEVPEYKKVVAQNEKLAVLMLQLRLNLFALKALSFVMDIHSKWEDFKNSNFEWQPNFNQLTNSAQLDYAVKITQAALDTYKRLTDHGYRRANPRILQNLLKKMNISTTPLTKNNGLAKQLVSGLAAIKKIFSE